MDGSADRIDERTAHEYAPDIATVDDTDAVLFDAIVVRYESERDRCTLVPHNGTIGEKLNGWVTTDLETVIDLDDMR